MQTVTVTLNGANDVAIVNSVPGIVAESDTTDVIAGFVRAAIFEQDTQDAAAPIPYLAGSGVLSASGPTPPSGTLASLFSFDPVTGAFSFDRADFNWLRANQNVTYLIAFQAQSGDDAPQSETWRVDIIGANDAPVAANDSYSINEDTITVFPGPGVLANDTDVDNGTTLSADLVAGPAHPRQPDAAQQRRLRLYAAHQLHWHRQLHLPRQ